MTAALLIALGANLGDREEMLRKAATLIAARVGSITAKSPLYETPPFGGAADALFLNAAVLVSTDLTPGAAIAELLAIEAELGRVRTVHWGNRTIDADIILWREGDAMLQLETPELTIPHPRAHERDFVMIPSAAIAPDWQHPLLHQSISALAAPFQPLKIYKSIW